MQTFLWYNVIVQKQTPQEHYTAYQLKFVVCHAKRKKLTSKIQKIRQGKQHLGGLKIYLNGFIKPFNQTIKHCFFVQTSLIGTKTAS